MAVISVDLAYKHYTDVGVVSMAKVANCVQVRPVHLSACGLLGRPTVTALAKHLKRWADETQARWIIIDGPQGWKAPDNGLKDARCCEAQCVTPGKTGLLRGVA